MPTAPPLKEIREAYSDYSSELSETQEEGRTDMRYASGDPWDPADRAERENAGRPCLSPDEITQYLNQAINNVRQNPRSVQVNPTGNGANDKLAGARQSLIQGIEYRSNAQTSDICAFENALQRSYGFSRITARYLPGSMNQELVIKPVQNPDMVIYNPYFRQPDGSDMEDLFFVDYLSKKQFKRKYPKVKPQSFSTDAMIEAPGWIRENYIVTAEYWKVHQVPKKLLTVEMPDGSHQDLYEDELKELSGGRGANGRFASARSQFKVLEERTEEIPTVVQYVTNGVEYLEQHDWPGSRIPFPACFGKQMFVNRGSGSKRILLSMVRLARDSQMMLAYYASQEAEEAGMTPKVPFLGYTGQFDKNPEVWETIHRVGRGYAEVEPTSPDAPGVLLPLPTRPQFQPNFEAYEIAKDSSRRSIQSSMGIAALPTAAQRQSEKSGVALEKIQTMEAIGAFHFTDNYNTYLKNRGFQLNELIPHYYDTQRDVPIRKPDGTHSTLHVVGNTSHPLNDRGAYDVRDLPDDHLHTGVGDYDETIDTGPSYDSQRVEQSAFVDSLLDKLPTLPIPPQVATIILAKAIRMKTNLGPVGNDIADLLDPPQDQQLPPAAQAQIAQMQGQMQQLAQENAALHADRAGRVLEQHTKTNIAAMQEHSKTQQTNQNNITKIVVAMLAAKSKEDAGAAQANAERELQILGFTHDAAHEFAMQVMGHGQAKDLASHQADLMPPPVAATQPQAAQ